MEKWIFIYNIVLHMIRTMKKNEAKERADRWDRFGDIGEGVQYWSRHLEERKRGALKGGLGGDHSRWENSQCKGPEAGTGLTWETRIQNQPEPLKCLAF